MTDRLAADGARTGEILELMGKEDARLVGEPGRRQTVSPSHLTVDDVMDWGISAHAGAGAGGPERRRAGGGT